MKRILVTGAGGAPTANFVRSLRLTSEPFYLIGVDSNKYYLQRAETDERHLVPPCDDRDYLPVLTHIIRSSGAEFLYAQPDVEIERISEERAHLPIRTFLPKKETVTICMNKYLSYEKWKEHGLKVPKTRMIHTQEDLAACFRELGPRVWIRETKGAFGKGSLPTSSYEQAKAWLDFQKGWGRYSCAECLDEQSVTWQSIWKDGELIVAQGRKRIYWEFANRAPSGVTGITGTGVTLEDPVIDTTAEAAIKAIDDSPNGIFSVDMTYDSSGVPNPTEINIGRFFTTHLFFSQAGLNMPYIYLKLAFDEHPLHLHKKINPLPSGLAWVRGMDFLPVLTTVEEIENSERELKRLREKLNAAN